MSDDHLTYDQLEAYASFSYGGQMAQAAIVSLTDHIRYLQEENTCLRKQVSDRDIEIGRLQGKLEQIARMEDPPYISAPGLAREGLEGT